MGLLDAGLAASIYRGFKGKLKSGIIRRVVVSDTAPLDDAGDPATTPPTDAKIEGFVENYSRYTQATAGIPDTDLKLNIFAASCPGVRPMAGNSARLDTRVNGVTVSQWYEIRGPIGIDPANVLWVCQAFEIPEPQ